MSGIFLYIVEDVWMILRGLRLDVYGLGYMSI